MEITSNEPDLTLISRRGRGQAPVTADTALELARRVYATTYGAADLAADEPLIVAEKGDVWIVSGSKKSKPNPFNAPPDGPVIMKISKLDAQILSFAFGLRLWKKRAICAADEYSKFDFAVLEKWSSRGWLAA